MVLISAVDNEGKTVRKCDARCYNAKGKDCTCVCGGRNHGIGFEAAKEKTLNEADAITFEHKEKHADLEVKIKV
jgi:hypothetical protein